MLEFVMTVAISGAGKTTWAHKQGDNYLVIDSDEMRGRLLGDEADQSQNARVFDEMYRITINALRAGQSVIYSATNLSSRRRINLLKLLKLVFPKLYCRCIVFNTPIDVCRERNSARSRVVPAYVIDKQLKQFEVPYENEGWNKIEVVNYLEQSANNGILIDDKEWLTIREKVRNFGSQQNKNHNLSLYEHCHCAGNLAYIKKYNADVIEAAYIHDYGKAWTAVRWPDKDDDLHYPNHANVGAYLALNMGYSLRIAQLVCYHMCPYMDERAQKTWRERLGNTLWIDIMRLHKVDEESH